MTLTAPTTNSAAIASATGLEASVRTSRPARFGSVAIGNDVAAPEMRNTAITER